MLDWNLSDHAVERALDMALDPEVIRALLSRPDTMHASGPDYPSGSEIWASGRVAAAVVPEERVVITFLWRGVEYQRGTDSEPYRDG